MKYRFTRDDLGMNVPMKVGSTLEEYNLCIIDFAKSYGWEDNAEWYGDADDSDSWRVYDIYNWLTYFCEPGLFWDFDSNDILTLQSDD